MKWDQLLSSKRLGNEHKHISKSDEAINRSEFERDFDRIIFSHPFRRLQDKTQVVPLPEFDFVHSRLTHSLEVSSVGRSLGKNAGEYILKKYPELSELGYTVSDFGSIVAAASLTHDIGNPPFGHSGEQALSEYFIQHQPNNISEKEYQDLVKFEGNAQGFRLLCDTHLKDIKLTYATIGAFTKYPCESIIHKKNKERKSQKKFGFFQSEKQQFELIAEELGLIKLTDKDLSWCRHPLAFLVEAADDICYLIIDLEDAVRMQVIGFELFLEMVSPIIGNKLDKNKLNNISDIHQRIGLLRAMAINQLVNECTEIFIEHEAEILKGEFDQSLSDNIPSSNFTNEIANYSFKYIYNAQHVLEIQAAGFEVLPGLLDYLCNASDAYFLNPKNCTGQQINTIRMMKNLGIVKDDSFISPYLRYRNIIDYLSGMTDRHAVNFYRKIKGISL